MLTPEAIVRGEYGADSRELQVRNTWEPRPPGTFRLFDSFAVPRAIIIDYRDEPVYLQ